MERGKETDSCSLLFIKHLSTSAVVTCQWFKAAPHNCFPFSSQTTQWQVNCPSCSMRSKSAGTETTPLKNFARPSPPTPWTALGAGGSQMTNAPTDPTARWPESLRYLSVTTQKTMTLLPVGFCGLMWLLWHRVLNIPAEMLHKVQETLKQACIYPVCPDGGSVGLKDATHLFIFMCLGKHPVFAQDYTHNMSPISRSHPATIFSLNLSADETSLVDDTSLVQFGGEITGFISVCSCMGHFFQFHQPGGQMCNRVSSLSLSLSHMHTKAHTHRLLRL